MEFCANIENNTEDPAYAAVEKEVQQYNIILWIREPFKVEKKKKVSLKRHFFNAGGGIEGQKDTFVFIHKMV